MNELQEYTTSEQRLFHLASQKRLPISGSMELLPLCNMNCKMCYVRLSHEEMVQQGYIRSADEWLKIATELQEEGVLFLLLTGGEPFLHPEFEKIYLSLKKMGFIITINTNGTLITPELASFLKKMVPRRVNVTLYGASRDTYSRLCGSTDAFDRTVNGIKLLIKNDVPVKINVSMTKENLNDLDEIFRLGQEWNVPISVDSYMQMSKRERTNDFDSSIRLTPAEAAQVTFRSTQNKMDNKIFLEYIDQLLHNIAEAELRTVNVQHNPMNCMAGKCAFSINWKGLMQPCSILSSPSISVFDYGVTKAWNILTHSVENISLNRKCAECKYRPLCRTCAASALYETGTYDGIPDYMCQYAETLYQLFIKASKENI